MTISKTTDLGRITVSDIVFAEVVEQSFRQGVAAGKVWPATKKGKPIGTEQKFDADDLVGNFDIRPSIFDDKLDIEFYIIVKFGAGIKAVTDVMCQYIFDTIKEKYNRDIFEIKVKVVGIKSKHIAKRDLEVINRYGAE